MTLDEAQERFVAVWSQWGQEHLMNGRALQHRSWWVASHWAGSRWWTPERLPPNIVGRADGTLLAAPPREPVADPIPDVGDLTIWDAVKTLWVAKHVQTEMAFQMRAVKRRRAVREQKEAERLADEQARQRTLERLEAEPFPDALQDLLDLVEIRTHPEAGREMREQLGLSQRELAAMIQVNASTLSRWESGQRRPRGKPAKRYLAIYRGMREAVK